MRACGANDPQLAEAYLTGAADDEPGWCGSTDARDELARNFRLMTAVAKHVLAAALLKCASGEDNDPDEAASEDHDELQDFIAKAEDAADEAEQVDSNNGRASWSDWVVKALQGGGGAAHRFVKGPDTWQPAGASVNGSYSVAPGNLLVAEHNRCADLWVTQDEAEVDESFVSPSERIALPRLTVEQLRAAGSDTPVKKAVTYDGFHPRHAAMVSD